MKFGIFAAAAIAVALCPLEMHGQVVGDTLRYRETAELQMAMEMAPGLEMTTTVRLDASISFWQISADSAHAWYDEIAVNISSPAGETVPDMTSFQNQTFILRIDERGRMSPLQGPSFIPSLQGMPDLGELFRDFLPSRPKSPLAVGLVWSDTSVVTVDSVGIQGEARSDATYTVVKDTVFEEVPAFVIVSDGNMHMGTPGPIEPRPGMAMDMSIGGPNQSRFIVAKDDGRLLLRTKSADLTGTIKSTGERAMNMNFRQVQTGEIRLIEPVDQ